MPSLVLQATLFPTQQFRPPITLPHILLRIHWGVILHTRLCQKKVKAAEKQAKYEKNREATAIASQSDRLLDTPEGSHSTSQLPIAADEPASHYNTESVPPSQPSTSCPNIDDIRVPYHPHTSHPAYHASFHEFTCGFDGLPFILPEDDNKSPYALFQSRKEFDFACISATISRKQTNHIIDVIHHVMQGHAFTFRSQADIDKKWREAEWKHTADAKQLLKYNGEEYVHFYDELWIADQWWSIQCQSHSVVARGSGGPCLVGWLLICWPVILILFVDYEEQAVISLTRDVNGQNDLMEYGQVYAKHTIVEVQLWGHHMWNELKTIIKNLKQVQILDQHCNAMPIWCNLTYWKQIININFSNRSKFEDISRIILYISQDIAASHKSESPRLYKLLKSLEVHTTETLAALEAVITKYVKSIQEYQIFATLCDDSIFLKSWNFPKQHMIHHMDLQILEKEHQFLTSNSIAMQIEHYEASKAASQKTKQLTTQFKHIYLGSSLPPPSFIVVGTTLITEYRYVKTDYASVVNWRLATDYLRYNLQWAGKPCYNHIIFNISNDQFLFGQIILAFIIDIGSEVLPMVFIRPFDQYMPTSISRAQMDRDLELIQIQKVMTASCIPSVCSSIQETVSGK
ncbi:hypothetical protein OBBRIDRAFT_807935 [Obba rivulosa]|uniref:Uncharacterized protein n=1 Tax=Obba rivulosa TaxID=1052685 RepID=A0A8E2DFI6_9APHY|nr:hypothetical protein OBBRIDRAFT_807935 [Obba rivulosa]